MAIASWPLFLPNQRPKIGWPKFENDSWVAVFGFLTTKQHFKKNDDNFCKFQEEDLND